MCLSHGQMRRSVDTDIIDMLKRSVDMQKQEKIHLISFVQIKAKIGWMSGDKTGIIMG